MTILPNSNVQFNQLNVAWDGSPQNSVTTLNVGNSATVTFRNNGYVGSAGNVSVSLSSGSTLNFDSSAWFGNWNQRATVVQGPGQGAAEVNVAGTLYANGRFVASGGTLAVNYGSVGQTTDGSMGDNTRSGWYALNGGQLTLPALTLYGTGPVNWGETAGSGLNSSSLVNGLQISPLTGSSLRGMLDISLLAPDNPAVLPGLTDPVGIWSFSRILQSACLCSFWLATFARKQESCTNMKGFRLLAGVTRNGERETALAR